MSDTPAMLTPAMAHALARKAERAIEAQHPDVAADYVELVAADAVTYALRGDGRAVMVLLGGIPLCDATFDELRAASRAVS